MDRAEFQTKDRFCSYFFAPEVNMKITTNIFIENRKSDRIFVLA